MARSKIPAPKQCCCQCGSMITMVPWSGNHSILIPIDIDREPTGGLVIVGSRDGYTVELATLDPEPPANIRRRAHWDVCPRPEQWQGIRARVVPGLGGDRTGPCARCGQRHPYRYGGPVASTLCDPCRRSKGLPSIKEIVAVSHR